MQPTTSTTDSRMARGAETLGEAAQAGIDRFATSAHDAVDRATSTAVAAADRLGAKSDEWMNAKNRAVASTTTYVREHPFTAIGIALAVGVLLSRLTQHR